jgi:hypothetical protein
MGEVVATIHAEAVLSQMKEKPIRLPLPFERSPITSEDRARAEQQLEEESAFK